MASHDFSGVDDAGLRTACELTQRLARVILERVGPPQGAPGANTGPTGGYSRRQLGADSGVSAATIVNLLYGRHFPQIHVATKLLAALGLPPEWLLLPEQHQKQMRR